MNRNNRIRSFISWAVLIVICIIAATLIANVTRNEKAKYSDIVNYFKTEQVTEFEIVGNKLTYKLKPAEGTEAKEETFMLYSTARFLDQVQPYIESAVANGVLSEGYDIQQAASIPLWVTAIPYIFFTYLFYSLLYIRNIHSYNRAHSTFLF